ncbi:hypothetical protein HZB03_03120 [Candidatus Woesearchaeota archaeon]|nr:hypothetical protein [Candidatus Woesearchaeota archaeon]
MTEYRRRPHSDGRELTDFVLGAVVGGTLDYLFDSPGRDSVPIVLAQGLVFAVPYGILFAKKYDKVEGIKSGLSAYCGALYGEMIVQLFNLYK